MALNRHFRRHFVLVCSGNSAISRGGLSPGENDPGLLGETVAGTRRREGSWAPVGRRPGSAGRGRSARPVSGPPVRAVKMSDPPSIFERVSK